jgi:hypothetical protein
MEQHIIIAISNHKSNAQCGYGTTVLHFGSKYFLKYTLKVVFLLMSCFIPDL